MKVCNVKKADTFLVTRIPSWKLFSRLKHLCIKRAIVGKDASQGIEGISSPASESSTSPRETRNPDEHEPAHYREQQRKLGQSATAAHSIPDV